MTGRRETREQDVWRLRVKSPGTPGLKRNNRDQGNALLTVPTGFRGWNESMSNLTYQLEDKSDVPIVDETGLEGRFDFDLHCTQTDLEERNWEKVNEALDSLGLELAPGHEPIEMLVVEKAN